VLTVAPQLGLARLELLLVDGVMVSRSVPVHLLDAVRFGMPDCG
jgi:hypothetical protein